MTWQQSNHASEFDEAGKSTMGSFPANERCFIRKQHKCGKMHGASKSCFIACPTDDNLEPILELMSEKLGKNGIEPIIAVKERAYGQDIFCTKICGKIIESRFCIVILDDTVSGGGNIPNPNVYYEYGIMTALGKHIVPLQKEDLELAFNIQSYDTIKYSPKNVGAEIDRAIRDAIKLTEAKAPEMSNEAITEKKFLHRMEISGFVKDNRWWFFPYVIEDTAFKAFMHPGRKIIAFVGKIDDYNDIRSYLDDLAVAIYRTDSEVIRIEGEIAKSEGMAARQRVPSEGLLRFLSNIYFAFIVNPPVHINEFLEAANAMLTHSRYAITYNKEGKIQFGNNMLVDLYENHQ